MPSASGKMPSASGKLPEIKSSKMIMPVFTPVSPVGVVENGFFFSCSGEGIFDGKGGKADK